MCFSLMTALLIAMSFEFFLSQAYAFWTFTILGLSVALQLAVSEDPEVLSAQGNYGIAGLKSTQKTQDPTVAPQTVSATPKSVGAIQSTVGMKWGGRPRAIHRDNRLNPFTEN